MNESRIFEIVLNEYDSHVGYTDNYQKKGCYDNSKYRRGLEKMLNDWDAGVNQKESQNLGLEKATKPFEKKVNEEGRRRNCCR